MPRRVAPDHREHRAHREPGPVGAREELQDRDRGEHHRGLPGLHPQIEGEQRERQVVAGEGERLTEGERETEAVEEAEDEGQDGAADDARRNEVLDGGVEDRERHHALDEGNEPQRLGRVAERRAHQGHGVGHRESRHHDQQVLDPGELPEGSDEADQEQQVVPTGEDVLDARTPEHEERLEGRRVERHPALPDADVVEVALPLLAALAPALVEDVQRHAVTEARRDVAFDRDAPLGGGRIGQIEVEEALVPEDLGVGRQGVREHLVPRRVEAGEGAVPRQRDPEGFERGRQRRAVRVEERRFRSEDLPRPAEHRLRALEVEIAGAPLGDVQREQQEQRHPGDQVQFPVGLPHEHGNPDLVGDVVRRRRTGRRGHREEGEGQEGGHAAGALRHASISPSPGSAPGGSTAPARGAGTPGIRFRGQ